MIGRRRHTESDSQDLSIQNQLGWLARADNLSETERMFRVYSSYRNLTSRIFFTVLRSMRPGHVAQTYFSRTCYLAT